MLRINLLKLGKKCDSNFSGRSMKNLVPTFLDFLLAVRLEFRLSKKDFKNVLPLLYSKTKNNENSVPSEILQGLSEMVGSSRQYSIVNSLISV